MPRPLPLPDERDGIHGGYRNKSPHTISQILGLPGGGGGGAGGRGGEGGDSGVKTQNTQSAKICLNFNFFWAGGGGTLESKLKILKVPRYA